MGASAQPKSRGSNCSSKNAALIAKLHKLAFEGKAFEESLVKCVSTRSRPWKNFRIKRKDIRDS
eukprot:9962031-Prorocentrum_lima.AAC.1